MTSGHDAANPAAPGASPPESGTRGGGTERLGPHPPRMEPPGLDRTGAPRPLGGFATAERPVVGAGQPPAGSAQPYPPRREPATGAFPAHPGPPYPPGPVTGGFAAVPGGPPPAAPPGPHTGLAPHSRPAGPPAAPPARGGRGVAGPVALIIVLVLLAAFLAQTFLLLDTRGDLADARRAADAGRTATEERLAGAEERVRELERRAGNTLDAAAVATDVLPSVFRVRTGGGTGTAFAFGNVAADGSTQLLTNYHVVEDDYEGGVRQVALEQQNRRFTAQVVKVDPIADLALLVATEKFPRLGPSADAARPGQPVVVVGAPLGLEDTVTSGVVSAVRSSPRGPVLQFDASVNPGNSGGPVVNAQKQVVGIVNAKLNNAEGISLGIPVAVACQTFGLC